MKENFINVCFGEVNSIVEGIEKICENMLESMFGVIWKALNRKISIKEFLWLG
jgi:hypothetical protein